MIHCWSGPKGSTKSSWSPEIKVKQEVRESSGNGARVKGCLEHKDPSCIRGQRVLFGHTEANSEIQTRRPGSGWREGRACSMHQEITSVQTAAACSTSLQQQALHTCFQTRSWTQRLKLSPQWRHLCLVLAEGIALLGIKYSSKIDQPKASLLKFFLK